MEEPRAEIDVSLPRGAPNKDSTTTSMETDCAICVPEEENDVPPPHVAKMGPNIPQQPQASLDLATSRLKPTSTKPTSGGATFKGTPRNPYALTDALESCDEQGRRASVMENDSVTSSLTSPASFERSSTNFSGESPNSKTDTLLKTLRECIATDGTQDGSKRGLDSQASSPGSPLATTELDKQIHTFKESIKFASAVVPADNVVPRRKMEEARVQPKDFKAIRLLGKGDVGQVYMVVKQDTKEVYAMKMLKKKDILSRNKIHRLLTEWEVLAKTDHPFIVSMYWSFQSKTKLYFVMEYCAGGELFHFLKQQTNGRVGEKNAKFYATEVLVALEYLHMMGVVYRDIKPENILIHDSGHLRLTDFDLSKTMQASQGPKVVQIGDQHLVNTGPDPKELFTSFVGTIEYLAPEVVLNAGHNSSVDWWGYGILIYEMLYGCTPFKGANKSQTLKNITSLTVKFPSEYKVSNTCKNLIRKLLHTHPERRLGSKNGAADIRAHKWLQGYPVDMIRNVEPPFIPKLRYPTDDIHFRMGPGKKLEANDHPISDSEEPEEPPSPPSRTTPGKKPPGAKISPYAHPAYESSAFAVDTSAIPFQGFAYYASKNREHTYGTETFPAGHLSPNGRAQSAPVLPLSAEPPASPSLPTVDPSADPALALSLDRDCPRSRTMPHMGNVSVSPHPGDQSEHQRPTVLRKPTLTPPDSRSPLSCNSPASGLSLGGPQGPTEGSSRGSHAGKLSGTTSPTDKAATGRTNSWINTVRTVISTGSHQPCSPSVGKADSGTGSKASNGSLGNLQRTISDLLFRKKAGGEDPP
uniref:non-specific serine/threonine protein kinase n=1 Tax=Eutreptiella gymnastica TaxID=73025 RepID=A0A7S1IKP2_9EUGL|mmetsp:Transcript_23839/g.42980  ORF Transcript_23839/g.42980 Transcript_23839/m.42980 type:complete len:810 (+) Transcript_23839:149-2578(+)